MNERCSAVLLNKLLSKEKDPGSFSIPCDIGQFHINNALADLGASISLMPYTMNEKLGLGEPKATRMSLELADRSIQYPRGIIENVLIKIDKFVIPIDFIILDMPEGSRVPIILGRPFLATARAMIDVFNKKIMLRVGDDEVIFDVDQSIKRLSTEDDECYRIDDLDDTINAEAQELLANVEPDSFLSRGLEKSIDQLDLEGCEPVECNTGNDSNEPIRRITSINTPYPIVHETTKPVEVEREHLYSASANEIDEKKLELKYLPHHLEYAYLHGEKSFPIIISSEWSDKEKISLLQVLEKWKGAIAWKMSDIKGISPSYWTHKILMEDDFKPPHPRCARERRNDCSLNDNNELIPSCTVTGSRDFSRFLSHLRIRKRQLSPVLTGLLLIDECHLDYATHRLLMTAIFHDMVEDFMEVFMDDFSVFGFDIEIKDKRGAENLATDHLSRLENPDLGTFMEEEITDEFPEEHLMLLKAKLNNNELWYVDYVNYIVGKIVPPNLTPEKKKRFFSQVKNYFWDEPYVFKLCSNNVMRRCVARNEILEILAHCHSGPTGGHHSASITERKVYESGFFWPSIFKDAKKYVMKCDACQRSKNISSRSEMPQNNIQGKLKSKWYGLNVVKTVYPYGTVEITDKNRINFKVNGQRLKKYHDGHIDAEDKEVVEFEENTT
ncbi:DNA-directed DNA polymerase [Tanacetum coccineum]